MNVPSLPPVRRPALSNEEWYSKIQQTVAWLVRAIAFWLAIALPFLYLPLLVGGFEARAEMFAFAGLVVLNLVALVVGHEYRR